MDTQGEEAQLRRIMQAGVCFPDLVIIVATR